MRVAILLAALLLAACGAGETDATGAMPNEARQLNEAAAMLDDDSVSVNAITLNDAGAARP